MGAVEYEQVNHDTVLMRDTCGNSRSKIKNYFYYKVYNSENFEYISNYDELILLDVLEGSKTTKDYFITIIPFLIIVCLGVLSIILWIFLCYCFKKPKGCLKRYSKANRNIRDSCFFIFFGFCSVILILIIVSLVYLNYAKSDINGAICTLAMLRYEIEYGQSLLEKKSFKKPFWYGINSLTNNIQKVTDLITYLHGNCPNIINNLRNSNLELEGNTFKADLEALYDNNKNEKIAGYYPGDTTASTIPLYISNLGYKENNETYTGKILQDYQTHYEYLINKITNPILEICDNLVDINGQNDLSNALNRYNQIISTLKDSMDLVALYVTKKISDELINLKNIYYVFYVIFLSLMGVCTIVMTILFFIYYYKPISAMNYSIKIVLYMINFLMIFCLVLSGLTGILYKYFSDSSDIVDCMYSSKNIGSDDPRIIPRTTDSSVLARCVRGDGNLLDEYLTDRARRDVLNLKQINTIYLKIMEAYNKINSADSNEYNTLSSLEQIIQDFTFMKDEFSLTTSKKESGIGDITYLLNELNKYTLKGMASVCNPTTYDLWSLRDESGQTVQINPSDNANQEIVHKSIITDGPSASYTGDCSTGFQTYYTALTQYKTQNDAKLNKLLSNTGTYKGLTEIKNDFVTNFFPKIKNSMDLIKSIIADHFWDAFGELVNDTNKYSGIEDAEKVDIFGWLNCSFLGEDYNITMNTFKETLVPDLKVVTYCSLVFEILIIALYFIIISLANNIRDKESEKQENGYSIESIQEDGGEIFEIVENNKYKKKYEAEGDIITVNRIKSKPKKKSLISINNTESAVNLNVPIDKTNDITKEEDINSIKKKLPDNIVQIPKFDIAENIEAIKNVDVRKLIDKNGRAVMHPIRISINSPLGVMEASDKYAHLYNYDVFEPYKEEESKEGSDIENGSYYQKSGNKSSKGKSSKKLGKVKKGKKGKKSEKGKDKENEKESKKSSDFSF